MVRLILSLLIVLLLPGCGGSQPKIHSNDQRSQKTIPIPPLPRAARHQKRRAVTIAWAGDTTLGSQYGLPPRHGRELLEATKATFQRADIAALNNEGTFGSGGASKCNGSQNCFAFQAPRNNARALQMAGIDIVNLANNHAYDFGSKGLQDTHTVLQRYGVLYTGQPNTKIIIVRHGLRIGFIGFSSYPWSNDLTDINRASRSIKRVDRHADIVVVLIHGGAEGADQTHTPYGTEIAFGENRGSLRQFAHAAVKSGADLILGSGPHVLRGMELYHGRLIAYSLGNLFGYHNFGTGGTLSLSGILTARLSPTGRFTAGKFTSLLINGDGIPQKDSIDQSAKVINSLSREDFGRRAIMIKNEQVRH